MTEGGVTGEAEELVDDEVDELPDPGEPGHPTFTALTGFFSGLVVVVILPAIYIWLMGLTLGEDNAEKAFPFVLLFLAVPIGLIAFPRTRRFGRYFLFGMVVTLIVVFGVGGLVLWLMLRYS